MTLHRRIIGTALVVGASILPIGCAAASSPSQQFDTVAENLRARLWRLPAVGDAQRQHVSVLYELVDDSLGWQVISIDDAAPEARVKCDILVTENSFDPTTPPWIEYEKQVEIRYSYADGAWQFDDASWRTTFTRPEDISVDHTAEVPEYLLQQFQAATTSGPPPRRGGRMPPTGGS